MTKPAFKDMDIESLEKEAETHRQALCDMKLKLVTNELKDTSHINKTKKVIAKIMTIINQKRSAS